METEPFFAVGDRVRVKDGVMTSANPDVCLGGWQGTIGKIIDKEPPGYIVLWSIETLRQLPADVRERFEWAGIWTKRRIKGLRMEESELLPDDGVPPEINPFVANYPHPDPDPNLDWNDQLDRIRAAFGLKRDQPLPKVSAESLLAYKDYLQSVLGSEWRVWDDMYVQCGIESSPGEDEWDFNGILDYCDPADGVLCRLSGDAVPSAVVAALTTVKSAGVKACSQLFQDYTHWFRNFR